MQKGFFRVTRKPEQVETEGEMDKPEVRISVRNLVEFILRSGDLTTAGRGALDPDSMQKGSRLHRKIQKQKGTEYQAEVPLKIRREFEDLFLTVEGRADGIFTGKDGVWIDEIKGTYSDISKMEEPAAVHRAQAMCYGAIYAEQNGLSSIGIQITYADLETEQTRYFREVLTIEELQIWFLHLTEEYHKWESFHLKWIRERNASMEGLEFPFPYRTGQRDMVKNIYHSITVHKQIFIQAPTGVGKTMSAVFPSIRAVGQGMADMLFYLTARTITRSVAEEAFEILSGKGLRFKSLTITAKEKICLNDKTECDPEHCPYAKGHFDRVNDAVFSLLTMDIPYIRENLRDHAARWQVCPFEMSLDLASWMDAVICDYNYVFDPDVYLKRFFGENQRGRHIFLVDEAHNLPERGREMYSAAVSRQAVLDFRRQIKKANPRLYKSVDKVNKALRAIETECEEWETFPNAGSLPLMLLEVMGEMERMLEDGIPKDLEEAFMDFYFMVRSFLNISELVDDQYVIYARRSPEDKVLFKLFCVNPAGNLQKRLDKGICTAFFSATFYPLSYYRKLLSTREDDFGTYVRSSFSQENRCILTGLDVSTVYRRRGYQEYRKIAEYIARAVWRKKGNYMAFFPSYKMLSEVYEIYQNEFSASWVRCICQTQDMRERDREDFLREFRAQKDTLLGFCIMGGIFSEGIDLAGESLIGVIVVGAGLPQVGAEREILKEYYSKRGLDGFAYAYRNPGMNKVLQAAGRLIRTKDDVGIILLLDERFGWMEYDDLFPVEWADRQRVRISTVEQRIGEFWDSHAKSI